MSDFVDMSNIPEEIRVRLPEETCEVIHAFKDQVSRRMAWSDVPELPGNPWRRVHTMNYWAWYRSARSHAEARRYLAREQEIQNGTQA